MCGTQREADYYVIRYVATFCFELDCPVFSFYVTASRNIAPERTNVTFSQNGMKILVR